MVVVCAMYPAKSLGYLTYLLFLAQIKKRDGKLNLKEKNRNLSKLKKKKVSNSRHQIDVSGHYYIDYYIDK